MVISLFISNVILCYFETLFNVDINNIDIDNARYTLSSLVQGEAAIVAIVITLTLVAVQQTSSSYSTRLIDVIKYRNPDFWILLAVYMGSIIYEFSILISLNGDIILKGHIFFAYVSGLFSLIALLPYMLNTIDLLKPSKMAEFLSEKVTKDAILSVKPTYFTSYLTLYDHEFIDNDIRFKNYEDPVLPLVDLINSSLMKYDYDTSKHCLLIIIKSSLNIIENNNVENEDFKKICTFFTKHFFSIGKLAIYKDDKTCADLVMHWFYTIAVILFKKQEDHHICSPDPIDAIGKLGEIAAEEKNTELIVTAIGYLRFNIDQSFENNVVYLQRSITASIGHIGEKCVEYRVRDISSYVLDPLFRIIRVAFKEKIEYKDKYNDFSEEFKEAYVEHFKSFPELPDDLVMLALKAIFRMGEIAAHEANMKDDLETILRYVQVIGEDAKKIGREDVSRLTDSFFNKYLGFWSNM
jgi:Predicted membrane protein